MYDGMFHQHHRQGRDVTSNLLFTLCEDIANAVDMMIRSKKQSEFPSFQPLPNTEP